jgi:hypothetical protein
MKWFQPIPDTVRIDNTFAPSQFDLKNIDESLLQQGRVVEHWDTSIWYRPGSLEEDGEPTDALLCYPGEPVFSSRLQSALISGGIGGVQFLPINLYHFDGSPILGYAFVNILSVIPALDLEKSEYFLFGDVRIERKDEILMLLRPVLRREALGDFDIIRLKEYPNFFFISQKFHDIFVQLYASGYSFKEVELS